MEKKLAHSDTLTKKGTIVSQERGNSLKHKKEVISKTKKPKKAPFSSGFKKAINSHKMQGLALVVAALFMVSTISLIFPSEGGVDVLTYTQEGNAGEDDEIYDAMQERNPGEVYKFDPYPDYDVMGIPLGDSHELQIDFQAVNLGTEDIFLQVWNYNIGDWNTRITINSSSSTPLAYTLTSDEILSGVCKIRFVDSDQTFGDTLQSTLGIDYVRVYTTGAGSSTGDDYVDDNTSNIDGVADIGTHSNFDNQKAKDSAYDMLTETGGTVVYPIEDFVDSQSNVDSSADIGTHSNFTEMKYSDSNYDILNESSASNNLYSADCTGDYFLVGTGGSANWVSTSGTISFWIKWDVTALNGRFWGQDGNFEARASLGAIVLDWGGTGSLTGTKTDWSTDHWYFIAIVWDGTNDDLFIYWGDETTTPTLDNSNTNWLTDVTGFTQNNIMNSRGGFYAVDGHIDDFRHYDIARTLSEIQSDYKQQLTGSESGLVNYYQFENSLSDSAGSDDLVASGSSWDYSLDVPQFLGGSGQYILDLEVQFTGVIHFLSSETLCIYAGAFSSAENITVEYWTGSTWSYLVNLTANSWNNVSVSLTSETFTIRFIDGIPSPDASEDNWEIDAVLLRVSEAGSNEDAVDNDTSNVDGSSDLGTLSNFNNMKTKNGMATLTEASTGDITDEWGITTSSFTQTSTHPTYRYIGGTSPNIAGMTVTHLWVRAGTAGTFAIALYTGGTLYDPTGATRRTQAYNVWCSAGWNQIDVPDYSWQANTVTWIGWAHSASIYFSGSSSDAGDFQTARGRWSQTYPADADETAQMPFNPGTGSFSNSWYAVYAEYTYPGDYRLDQEVQWTNFPYQVSHKQLCIYAGTFTGTAEDIRVDIWNGTTWVNIFSKLNSTAWNNVSISSYADSPIFTIRFVDQGSDGNENSWEIDVALIYVWQEASEPFELDLEIRWIGLDTSESYYNLSIYCGTFTTTEALEVWIWSGFGWDLIISSLTPSSWNNFTITSYVFSSTVIIRFLGAVVQSDVQSSSWNIDASIIFGWTPGITATVYTSEGNAKVEDDVLDEFNETGTGTIPTALNAPHPTLTREPGIEATFEVTFRDTYHDVNITNANVTYEWDNGTGSFVYDANEVGNGVYNFTINTTSLDVGTYYINVNATKENYDNQTLLLTLEIVPISTTLTVDKAVLIIEHGETAVYNFNFSAKNQGFEITGANLTYEWDYGSGELVELGDGVYRLNILTDSVDVGSYYIDVNATLEKCESQLLQLTLEVLPISTILTADKVTLTKEHGQIAVFNVTFSTESLGYGVTGANLTYVWDYGSGELVEVGDGIYRLTISESIINSLEKGTYSIDITASLKNYESQSLQLSLVIEVPSGGGGDGGVSTTAFIGLAAAVGGALAGFFLLYGRTGVSPAVRAINKNIDQLENGKTPPQRPISTREEKVSSILDERFKLLDEI